MHTLKSIAEGQFNFLALASKESTRSKQSKNYLLRESNRSENGKATEGKTNLYVRAEAKGLDFIVI